MLKFGIHEAMTQHFSCMVVSICVVNGKYWVVHCFTQYRLLRAGKHLL